MPDDIKTDRPPAGSTEKPDAAPPITPAPKREPHVVGPESEVRGGHEAPDEADDLD